MIMSNRRITLLPDLSRCPCAGVNLEKLIQPAILTVLSRGELHGYCIVQQIGRMVMFPGETPDSSGVYRHLKSLEDRGIVQSNWDVSARGPAKRLYRLTPTGWQCLGRWIETLRNYRQAMGRLLTEAQKALRRADAV
jgi:PadR family transcriptional regulator, regulatory protein PadR